jgi:hypothetical protein
MTSARWLLVPIALAIVPEMSAVAQSSVERLSAAQLAAVERGQRLVITQARSGAPWPAVTVFAYVQATPERASAVFEEYERHVEYIPGVRRSHVSRIVDSATVEVDYTLAVPIFPDERYTVRDRVTRDSTGFVRVDWTLVRASSTKAISGHARFVPHRSARTGTAGTLIEYDNFVIPGSRLAGLGYIRNQAVKQVDATVAAIVKRIQERAAEP